MFTTSLTIKPRFSKRFALLLMTLHSVPLLLLLPLALPLIIKLCLGLLVLLSSLHSTRRHLLLINHPLNGCVLGYDKVLDYDNDKQLSGIRVQIQSEIEAKIAAGSYSHPQLVILRLKNWENGKIDTLVIFPDALDVETFRQLRVHLRHGNNIDYSSIEGTV